MERLLMTPLSILWHFLWVSSLNSALARTSPYQNGFGGKLPIQSFSVSWLDDKTTYQAGDIATIKVKLFDGSFSNENFNLSRYSTNFSLSVNGKKGNSSYISGVLPYFERDPTFWNVSFTPIRVGEFSMVVKEEHSGISDSSLHFTVTSGHIYPSACETSWMDLVDEFAAGSTVKLLVLLKDAFGNNISSVDGPSKDYFMVFSSFENGSAPNMLDFRNNGWNEVGCVVIEFVPITCGNLLLHVYGANQTLNGSPLPFLVKPGSFNITNSLAKWKYEINSLQVFSKLEIFIYQKDQFGNIVPGFYAFDARVVEKATNLSVPVADLFFQEVAHGIQLLSLTVSEPGDFMITIFNYKLNQRVPNMPYEYTVFTGYCHGLNSFANGSGLIGSVAGITSDFTVYLEDLYHNPSPVEVQRLQVRIISNNGTPNVRPVIYPLRSLNGTINQPVVSEAPRRPFPAYSVTNNRIFFGNSTVHASEFKVSYTPEKSGEYEIWVFCGNIPINTGQSYLMKASPGLVDISQSIIIQFEPRIKKLMRSVILVQLVDAFSNPVPLQETKLSLEIKVANTSNFMRWNFADNGDGSYVGYYLSRDLGTYNICVTYEDKHLSPCPLEVQVYERNYFPDAYNDSISVWEDESVAFDVLSNDYIPGGQATITIISKPLHGSLLQYEKLFRYTPYRGFFGNDSFTYSFSDINQNVATGTSFISVLCKPPQFVSLPVRLKVTEDIISPKFGGFSGFEIMYSNLDENVSLTVGAQSGTVFLAPMTMQFCHLLETTLLVTKGGRSGKDLILSGHAEIVNSALQSIQYLGNENFYGNDIINLYAMNINGIQDAHVPVLVEPTNDPPIIHAPKFIILGKKETNDGLQIFDKQRDTFEFSVGDPDILSFPGNNSHLMFTFSMEVDDGILSTRLPVHLIKTSEIKIKSSNQWQPLQTFVTISNHFVVKGKGMRFRGTIGDCNNAMQRLFYRGENQGAILIITVNDLGNYGCYPDSADVISSPLFTEATVNLIRRRPIGSATALCMYYQ
ncbi:protein GAMETE EXPRESSED 2-like [Iris pallida]|uniref:Protein GAMETE EXPRESSED 2-like n=1 Tax=Iris pallida TaxID=29817 RepID=A0AAX6EX45_IRIPA|nr:protein GAMETE EXPRESSED 2-like [Iris pallida]